MDAENTIYRLLSLKFAGEATAEDLIHLQQLLAENPEFQFLYDQLHQPISKTITEEDTAQAYAAHYAKIIQQSRTPVAEETFTGNAAVIRNKKRVIPWLAAAATIMIAFTTYYFWPERVPYKVKGGTSISGQMSTTKGSRSSIVLPDGTKVTLNADSKLIYGKDFSSEHREVSFEGEAFFDVKHDPSNPFIIHTGKINIRVLGTTFNLRNYAAERKAEATLINGRIELQLQGEQRKKVLLSPMQKAVIYKDVLETRISEPDSINIHVIEGRVNITPVTRRGSLISETSWLNNKLAFDNVPLEDIVLELERRFNITVVFKSDKFRQYRYTGIFDDSDLTEVMEILSLTKKINYQIHKNVLIIE